MPYGKPGTARYPAQAYSSVPKGKRLNILPYVSSARSGCPLRRKCANSLVCACRPVCGPQQSGGMRLAQALQPAHNAVAVAAKLCNLFLSGPLVLLLVFQCIVVTLLQDAMNGALRQDPAKRQGSNSSGFDRDVHECAGRLEREAS